MREVLRREPEAVHPCFNLAAARRYGRIHLPVARQCNLSCIYCDRTGDCPHESRPGQASRLLSPVQAAARVMSALDRVEGLAVAGIAGPGDPLAEPGVTLETLELVREACPGLVLCVSTNGLGLPGSIEQLVAAGLDCLTVTVNSVDPGRAGFLAGRGTLAGRVLTGSSLGRVLIDRQLAGLELAVSAGLLCKVNVVLVPGVNDGDVADVAREVRDVGVRYVNLVPVLAPERGSVSFPSATHADVRRAAATMPAGIHLLTHCRRCRADAVGLLGCDYEGGMTL